MKTPTKRPAAEAHTAPVVSSLKVKRPSALRRRLLSLITRREIGVDYEQMQPDEKKAAVAQLETLVQQIRNEPDFLLTHPMVNN